MLKRIAGFEDRVCVEWRVRLYAIVIATALAAILVWKIFHGASLVDPAGRPRCNDFYTMWVTGELAASGEPTAIYDDAAWAAAWKKLTGLGGSCPLLLGHTGYPPTLLFFTYPLGLLSFSAAFVFWTLGTLTLYAAAVYAVLPRSIAVIAALTPIVVAENFLLGQNGFLSAGIIGYALALMQRRPTLGGLVIGLLSYKPQFGLLFPLALLASRNWRALLGAAAMSLSLCVTAAIAFGLGAWSSFFETLLNRTSDLGSDRHVELTLQSVYGLLHWAGFGSAVAWGAHLAAAAATSVIIWILWSRPVSYSLRAAALALGTVMVTPYVQMYDLCILTIAVAFLVRDGISYGFLAGERISVVMLLAGLVLLWRPFGPILEAALLLLVLRRVAERQRIGSARPGCSRFFHQVEG